MISSDFINNSGHSISLSIQFKQLINKPNFFGLIELMQLNERNGIEPELINFTEGACRNRFNKLI